MNEPNLRAAGITDVKFGKNVTVVQPVNLYGCEIDDESFIGPFVEIQKGVRIGKRSRIQSHAFICELVVIGDDCFISHGAMFINDLFAAGGPSGGNQDLWERTRRSFRSQSVTLSSWEPAPWSRKTSQSLASMWATRRAFCGASEEAVSHY